MDLLVLLSAHPGEVLSRESLIDQVWKVEYGADESLTRAVSLLRKTFREAGHADEIIETIPKRGYRLLIAPTIAPVPVPPTEHPSSRPAARRHPRRPPHLSRNRLRPPRHPVRAKAPARQSRRENSCSPPSRRL